MKKIWLGFFFIFLITVPVFAKPVTVNNYTYSYILVVLAQPGFGIQDLIAPNSSKVEETPFSDSMLYIANYPNSNHTPYCQGTMMVNQTLSIYYNSSTTLDCQVT